MPTHNCGNNDGENSEHNGSTEFPTAAVGKRDVGMDTTSNRYADTAFENNSSPAGAVLDSSSAAATTNNKKDEGSISNNDNFAIKDQDQRKGFSSPRSLKEERKPPNRSNSFLLSSNCLTTSRHLCGKNKDFTQTVVHRSSSKGETESSSRQDKSQETSIRSIGTTGSSFQKMKHIPSHDGGTGPVKNVAHCDNNGGSTHKSNNISHNSNPRKRQEEDAAAKMSAKLSGNEVSLMKKRSATTSNSASVVTKKDFASVDNCCRRNQDDENIAAKRSARLSSKESSLMKKRAPASAFTAQKEVTIAVVGNNRDEEDTTTKFAAKLNSTESSPGTNEYSKNDVTKLKGNVTGTRASRQAEQDAAAKMAAKLGSRGTPRMTQGYQCAARDKPSAAIFNDRTNNMQRQQQDSGLKVARKVCNNEASLVAGERGNKNTTAVAMGESNTINRKSQEEEDAALKMAAKLSRGSSIVSCSTHAQMNKRSVDSDYRREIQPYDLTGVDGTAKASSCKEPSIARANKTSDDDNTYNIKSGGNKSATHGSQQQESDAAVKMATKLSIRGSAAMKEPAKVARGFGHSPHRHGSQQADEAVVVKTEANTNSKRSLLMKDHKVATDGKTSDNVAYHRSREDDDAAAKMAAKLGNRGPSFVNQRAAVGTSPAQITTGNNDNIHRKSSRDEASSLLKGESDESNVSAKMIKVGSCSNGNAAASLHVKGENCQNGQKKTQEEEDVTAKLSAKLGSRGSSIVIKGRASGTSTAATNSSSSDTDLRKKQGGENSNPCRMAAHSGVGITLAGSPTETEKNGKKASWSQEEQDATAKMAANLCMEPSIISDSGGVQKAGIISPQQSGYNIHRRSRDHLGEEDVVARMAADLCIDKSITEEGDSGRNGKASFSTPRVSYTNEEQQESAAELVTRLYNRETSLLSEKVELGNDIENYTVTLREAIASAVASVRSQQEDGGSTEMIAGSYARQQSLISEQNGGNEGMGCSYDGVNYEDEEGAELEAQAGIPVLLPGAFAITGVDVNDDYDDADSTYSNVSDIEHSGELVFGSRRSRAEGTMDGDVSQFHDDVVQSSEFMNTGFDEEVVNDSPLEAELHDEGVLVQGLVVMEDFEAIENDPKFIRRLRMIQGAITCFAFAAIASIASVAVQQRNNFNRGRYDGPPTIWGWVQVGTDLIGPTDDDNGLFGYAVSMSGDGQRIVIGSPGRDGAVNQLMVGQVRILDWDGAEYWLPANANDIESSNSSDLTLAAKVAASIDDSVESNKTTDGHTEQQQEQQQNIINEQRSLINGPGATSEAGTAVAISSNGHRVAIGSPRWQSQRGHVAVYELQKQVRGHKSTASSPTEEGKWCLVGNVLMGDEEDDGRFGLSVDLSFDGNVLAVGAPSLDSLAGSDSGVVRVYHLMDNNYDNMNNTATDTNNDNPTSSVSTSSNSPGGDSAGDSTKDCVSSSSSWVQLGGDITGSESEAFFGWSLALSSNGYSFVSGAVGSTGGGIGHLTGSVQAYNFDGVAWVPKGSMITGEKEFDSFGISTTMSDDGNVFAAGAIGYSTIEDGVDVGMVRAFRYDDSTGRWIQLGQTLLGEKAFDSFGYSVSLSSSGEILAAGGPRNDDFGLDSGSIHIFRLAHDNNNDNSDKKKKDEEKEGGASQPFWNAVGGHIGGSYEGGDLYGWSVSLSSNGTRVAGGAPFSTFDGRVNDVGTVRVYDSIV